MARSEQLINRRRRRRIIRLRYINEFRDRHGKVRRYFRRSGQPVIALPGEPDSAEFLTAYAAALANAPDAIKQTPDHAPNPWDEPIPDDYWTRRKARREPLK